MTTQLSLPIKVITGKILYCQWGYSMTLVDFYEVIKETDKTILARRVESKVHEAQGFLEGTTVPDLDILPREKEIIRIYRRQLPNGNSYLVSRKQGYPKYFHWYDGTPVHFNECD